MKYPVLVLRNNEEKNYLFSIVDLPGCQVKAATMDEGFLLLNEAMISHLKIAPLLSPNLKTRMQI